MNPFPTAPTSSPDEPHWASPERFHLSRRRFVGTATAAVGATLMGGVAPAAAGLSMVISYALAADHPVGTTQPPSPATSPR